jgi:hypothetical protein
VTDPVARDGFDHCPFFCEENAYRLARALVPEQVARAPALLFITNDARAVGMAGQRAGASPSGFVVWDYHVVVCSGTGAGARIWDLDSRLPFPCPAAAYLAASFPSVPARHAPRFRLVDADGQLALCSDRRHMRDDDGGWLHPPPPWAPIGDGHTLDRFLDLADPIAGEVLDLDALRERFR